MRIGVCLWQFPVLSETFVLNQITWLLDRGHDVRIYAKRHMKGPAHGDVEKYKLLEKARFRAGRLTGSLGPTGARGPGMLRALRRPATAMRLVNPIRHGGHAASLRLLASAAGWMDDWRPEVLLCHFGPASALAARLRSCGVFDAPMAAFFHGGDLFDTGAADKAFLFREAERVCAVSQRMRGQLVEMGCPETKVRVQKMGVDLSRFAFVDRGVSFAEPLRLLTVARLVPIKGLEWAVRGVAALPETIRRRVRYTVVGGGPLMEELVRLRDSLGLAGTVEFTGSLDQDAVIGHTRDAHVFLFPSVAMPDGKQESMGVAAMEAMACGVPVIGARTGGIPELVLDGQCGFLVPEKDPAAIAGAIAKFLDNPGMLSTMGAAARKHVEQEHDLEKQNRSLEEMLMGLIAQHRATNNAGTGGER